tara:strand:+ start:263 stop:1237 length:975 start_codon:yes stop_codon:yes gene_type:complete
MDNFTYTKNLEEPTAERKEYLINQVKHLETLPNHIQRSPEWFKFREGLLTASDYGSILGTNKYSRANSVLKKKCEKNPKFFGGAACDWGKKYEDAAIQIYEKRNNTTVKEFGCIQHSTVKFLGASPDGITPEGVMVEIKCPYSRKITGIAPLYYVDQVKGQLEVCQLDRCDFLECELAEVKEEEYVAYDTFEKGIVLEYYNKTISKMEFIYLPLETTLHELAEHKLKNKFTNENYIYSSTSYWILKSISCIPIYHDVKWFEDALPKFRAFWDQVEHYREVGYDQFKKEKTKKSRNSGIYINTQPLEPIDVSVNSDDSDEPDSIF